jgi:hypothetical protein
MTWEGHLGCAHQGDAGSRSGVARAGDVAATTPRPHRLANSRKER